MGPSKERGDVQREMGTERGARGEIRAVLQNPGRQEEARERAGREVLILQISTHNEII